MGVDPDPNYVSEGGMQPPEVEPAIREIYLLQRKTTPLGIGLGKTSGWYTVHSLKSMAYVCCVVCNIKQSLMKDFGLSTMGKINFYV